MEDYNLLCPGCFIEKGATPVCPQCRYDEGQWHAPIMLPYRTLLNQHYLVGRVLGKPGGFGITYLGFDVRLEAKVAVKEYLPRELAGRDKNGTTVHPHSREDDEVFRYGLEQFLREARTLAKLDHPNVVRVQNYFEENGTAYLVMDYYAGLTLAEYLKQKSSRLSEKTAIEIMAPIMDGLREVHAKGFLHRDIKPQNIYLTANGRPILLDFGAARVAMNERSRSLSVVMTPGYAPYEQYHRRGGQGPWTDIYACAATLYHMVTGQTPAEATERVLEDTLVPPDKLNPELSAEFCNALLNGLAVAAKDRPRDLGSFQNLFLKLKSAPPAEKEAPAPRKKVVTDSPKKKTPAPRKKVTTEPLGQVPKPPVTPKAKTKREPKPAQKTTMIPVWAWGVGALVGLLVLLWIIGFGTSREPGIYLKRDGYQGDRITESMIEVVFPKKGNTGNLPDRPYSFEEIKSGCLTRYVSKDSYLTWDDIGTCK